MSTIRHYSEVLIDEIKSVEQPARGMPQLAVNKPMGLWLAIGDGWVEYCKSINWRLGNYAYDATLAPDANVALILTFDDLRRFSRRFGYIPEFDGMEFTVIDWHEVAKHHDGIVFMRRFKVIELDEMTQWSYGWDVASACIWNKAAICEFKRVLPVERVRPESDGHSPQH